MSKRCLNRVTLIGNIGSEPELKVFEKTGNSKLEFRMVTDFEVVNKDGEVKDLTDWHTIVMWGKRGEALHRIVRKGKQVYVEGRLTSRSYETKEGKRGRVAEVICDELLLLGKKSDDSEPNTKDYDDGGFGDDDGF